MLNGTSIPQTISTSYGDDEQTVPEDYATTVCNLFAQLGSRGSSVLFASGDNGVGGGDCKTNNNGTQHVQFQPGFPASCKAMFFLVFCTPFELCHFVRPVRHYRWWHDES